MTKIRRSFPSSPLQIKKTFLQEPNNGAKIHTAQHNLFLRPNQAMLLPARNDEMKEKLNADFQAIVTAVENKTIKPG